MISFESLELYFKHVWKSLPIYKKLLFNYLPIKLLIQKWDIPEKLNVKCLFIQSMDREDYNKFTNIIFHTIELDDKDFLLIQKKKKLNFDFLSIGYSDIRNIWNSLETKNIVEKIYIVLNILQVKSIDKYLKGYNLKLLIAHADMQPVENYMVQYFKEKGIKTVTLQHGLYIDYSKYPNINEVNYKNVVSDYFLSWGEETKELIEKYHSNCKVLLCGNPTEKEMAYKSKDFFTVVFDQELFKEYNKKLIHIAQELSRKINLKILLKPHPRNNLNDYDLDKDLFIDNGSLNNSAFVLGHTTTMMFQLMRSGIPVFKYQTDIPSNKFNNDLIFSNINELMLKLEKKDQIDYIKEGKYYIKYIDNNSLEKYKEVIERLI